MSSPLLLTGTTSRKIWDIALRIFILSAASGLFAYGYVSWPDFSMSATLWWRGFLIQALVYGFIVWLLIGLFTGSRSRHKDTPNSVIKFLFGLSRITVMVLLNFAVMIARVLLAAISPGFAPEKVGEALLHFVERTADLGYLRHR